jgi:hypothetical protein
MDATNGSGGQSAIGDGKLKWLSFRKKGLEQQLELAKQDNDGSGFAQFIKADLDQVVAEIEQYTASFQKSKHDDDSDHGRWRLVGKKMNEVCVEAKLQDYISRAFALLHAHILKMMNETNICLRTVHFRLCHLQNQTTVSTIFRFMQRRISSCVNLSDSKFSLHFLQEAHALQIHEKMDLGDVAVARHSSQCQSNIF